MKILYVVSRPLEINTSASIRNRTTIFGLLENEHEVDLVTTEPDKNHSAYDSSLVPDGVNAKYIRLGGAQSFARAGRKLAFLKPLRVAVYKWMNRHEIYDNLKAIAAHIDDVNLSLEEYDVIISSSDPKSSHLFVDKLLQKHSNEFKGRWIQIWGDPFFGDITSTNKKNAESIKAEEKRLLSGADRVVYVSKLTMQVQKKLYPESGEKMVYFPIPYMEEKKYQLRDLKSASPVELVYCGDYNSSVRDIKPLYNAVKSMKNVHLTICGGSDSPMQTCEQVKVYGRVPYEKVQELEKKADILVHLSNSSGSQIPGKIYQYSGTNKPILFILDGDSDCIKEQFDKYGRFAFSRNSSEKISKCLCDIITKDIEFFPITDFSRKNIASKIIER